MKKKYILVLLVFGVFLLLALLLSLSFYKIKVADEKFTKRLDSDTIKKVKEEFFGIEPDTTRLLEVVKTIVKGKCVFLIYSNLGKAIEQNLLHILNSEASHEGLFDEKNSVVDMDGATLKLQAILPLKVESSSQLKKEGLLTRLGGFFFRKFNIKKYDSLCSYWTRNSRNLTHDIFFLELRGTKLIITKMQFKCFVYKRRVTTYDLGKRIHYLMAYLIDSSGIESNNLMEAMF